MRCRSLFVALFALPALSQPVILLNGYQFPPCGNVTAEATFGELPQRLRDLGREVIFFNNCSVMASAGAMRPSLEDMAAALGQRIADLNVRQVDVVAHSMGGLILRAYLSGKQNTPGVFLPPADHKVRNAVFLGTPHFGPGLASTLLSVGGSDPQVRAILPGSRFLFDLATWNQGGDDLRGVEAIAVVGSVANGTDGLVPLPSSSLSFAAEAARTRVVPYCHTDAGALALVAAGCNRPPYLANVNGDSHLSWRITRSFLNGTEEWRTLGTALNEDPTGSTRGGLLVVARDKDDNLDAGVTAVIAGTTQLLKVADFHYAELIAKGSQSISLSASSGNRTSSQNITGGLYSVAVVKPGPRAAAILPAAGPVATRTLAPGMFVSLYGDALTSESAAAQSLPLPTTLAGAQLLAGGAPVGLQFAGPTQINAIMPEDAKDLVTLTVKSLGGAHRINVLVEPAIPAVFTQTGTGSGPASAIQASSGVVITAESRARAGDTVSLYLTGLGATETREGLRWARIQPKLYISGTEAQILYAGRAPGFAGLDQINFIVPANVSPGLDTALRVESNGRISNAVTLPTF